jgi:hypothetical protein
MIVFNALPAYRPSRFELLAIDTVIIILQVCHYASRRDARLDFTQAFLAVIAFECATSADAKRMDDNAVDELDCDPADPAAYILDLRLSTVMSHLWKAPPRRHANSSEHSTASSNRRLAVTNTLQSMIRNRRERQNPVPLLPR